MKATCIVLPSTSEDNMQSRMITAIKSVFANFIPWRLRWILVRDARLNDPVKTRQLQIKVDHGCYQKCRWKVSEGPNKVVLEQVLYVRTVYG